MQVPASINTFLRDYQREGVKFFWKQYQEGRGGLLGDDMGLVGENLIVLTIWLTAISRVSWSEIEISIIFPCTLSTGKTIQVISFLSAIMCKRGVIIDRNRRRKHVSRLQDLTAWKERRELPPANSQWPTCLIIAPSTVVSNWEREFITVRSDYGPFRSCPNPIKPSGGISKLVCMLVVAKNGSQ